jgi:hypothetical protein
MGYEAERAEDEYWQMSGAERRQAGRDIDSWRADEENSSRYGSLLRPLCADEDRQGWCGHPTAAHCSGCGGCPGEHQPSCDPGHEDMTWAPEDDFQRDAAYPSGEPGVFVEGALAGRLFSETLTEQLVRELTPEGRFLSLRTAQMGKGGWDAAQIGLVFAQPAERIRERAMADDGFDPPMRNRRRRMDKRDNRFYRTPSNAPDSGEESRLPVGALKLFATMGTAPMMEALAKAAMAAQEETSRFPVEPPEGSVLRYQKQFPNSARTYNYIAVRAGDRWYRTGRNNEPISFPELVEDIANWPCHVAIKWGEIPQAPASLFEGVDPAVWFEEMYQNTVIGESSDGKD